MKKKNRKERTESQGSGDFRPGVELEREFNESWVQLLP